MKDKDLKSLLVALNSSNDLGFKYPIGNKELTIKVRELESEGKIKYDVHTRKWHKRTNKLSNRLIDEEV